MNSHLVSAVTIARKMAAPPTIILKVRSSFRNITENKDPKRASVESIMAVANGRKGELVSAGIIYGWLTERSTGKRYGGLVCEHSGYFSREELENKLKASLNELFYNGFEEDYSLIFLSLFHLIEPYSCSSVYSDLLMYSRWL